MNTNKTQEKKVYFSGLNAVRFFAATAVIFHHIEQNKFWFNIPNHWDTPFIDALGHKAVSLFFVLSGFLITYLLMDEVRKTNTVSVKKFYLRRILRIWPLYYLLITIGFFVLPYILDYDLFPQQIQKHFSFKWFIVYLLLFPNLVRVWGRTMIGLNQSWSIGVEEQFYIIWPLLIKKFKDCILKFLIIFIILKMFLQILLYFIDENLYKLFSLLQIEQMAVGAIGAYILFHNKQKLLKIIYHTFTQIIIFVALIMIMLSGIHFIGITIIEGVVFTLFIMNVSVNDNFKFKLENKLFTRLGNISYGIYMYHTMVIALLMNFLYQTPLKDNLVTFNIVLYTGSVLITLLISDLSYRYFEMGFLKLKSKFQIIKSTDKK